MWFYTKSKFKRTHLLCEKSWKAADKKKCDNGCSIVETSHVWNNVDSEHLLFSPYCPLISRRNRCELGPVEWIVMVFAFHTSISLHLELSGVEGDLALGPAASQSPVMTALSQSDFYWDFDVTTNGCWQIGSAPSSSRCYILYFPQSCKSQALTLPRIDLIGSLAVLLKLWSSIQD